MTSRLIYTSFKFPKGKLSNWLFCPLIGDLKDNNAFQNFFGGFSQIYLASPPLHLHHCQSFYFLLQYCCQYCLHLLFHGSALMTLHQLDQRGWRELMNQCPCQGRTQTATPLFQRGWGLNLFAHSLDLALTPSILLPQPIDQVSTISFFDSKC